ncbi:MAG: restriction endonuclease [Nitrosomonadales bacterium]|nr:restriction endonuclease [Nitrosomonadales bacterium]
MNLLMNQALGNRYFSNSQKIRAISESWVTSEGFCPVCGGQLQQSQNNSKVLDFLCKNCPEEYELKSKAGKFARKVTDGAFDSMMSRIAVPNSPHFFFLGYDQASYSVKNFFVVPSYFFQASVIEKRKPLALTARRAGWTGCNILLDQIPDAGKIHYVSNGCKVKAESVLSAWRKTAFIGKAGSIESRGWMLDVLACIEKIKQNEFSLDEIYKFESELSLRHPGNNFVKDKIRQQLQVLRDKGFLEFMGRGTYKLAQRHV